MLSCVAGAYTGGGDRRVPRPLGGADDGGNEVEERNHAVIDELLKQTKHTPVNKALHAWSMFKFCTDTKMRHTSKQSVMY